MAWFAVSMAICLWAARWSAGACRLEYCFEFDFDADLGGDQQPATVEWHVPGQAPVFSVDGPGGGENSPVAAPWVGSVAEVLDLQGHRPGDAADGQFSFQQPAGTLPAGRAAGEGGRGIAGCVEVVG